MSRIRGKRILITGASSGIGLACAEVCASHGADLVLVARRLERLQATASLLQDDHAISVTIGQLDVRDRNAVGLYVERLKKNGVTIDILINNAGLSSGLDKLQEGDFKDWDQMIDTNIKGLLNISRAVIPMMVERGSGHVVNLGSIAGYQIYPGGNVYNATKFAVRALNEAMNIDLLGTDIRVSCVSPGAVQTEFSTVRFHGDETKADQVYQGYMPLQARDIAEAILFVISCPEHMNVQEMIVMPTAQRSVNHWHRQG